MPYFVICEQVCLDCYKSEMFNIFTHMRTGENDANLKSGLSTTHVYVSVHVCLTYGLAMCACGTTFLCLLHMHYDRTSSTLGLVYHC